MQKTENYNLKQPDVTDPVHVSDLNSNMAILDSAVHDAQTTAQEAKTSSDDLIKAAKGEQTTDEQLNNMSTLFSDPMYNTLYTLGYNISSNGVINADIFHTGTEDTGYLTIHDDITKDNGKNWGTGENSSLDATLADIYSKISGGSGDNAKADAMYDALDVQATSEAYPAADKLIPLYNLFEDNRMTVGDRIISTSGYPYGEDGRVGLELNECNIKLNDGVIKFDDGVIKFGDDITKFNASQLIIGSYTYEDEEGQPHDTSAIELDGYFGDIHSNRSISVGKLSTDYIMEMTDSDVTFSSGWPGGKISLRDTLTDIYDKIEEGGGGGSEYITIEDSDITNSLQEYAIDGWLSYFHSDESAIRDPKSLRDVLDTMYHASFASTPYLEISNDLTDIINSYEQEGDIYTGWLAYFDNEHSVMGDPHSLSSILNGFYETIGHATDLSFLSDDIRNSSGWYNGETASLKSIIADLYSKIAALSN